MFEAPPRRTWDVIAPAYDRAVALVGWHRMLDLLVDDVTAGTVLEVGCGPGYLGAVLMRRGVGYVGLDSSRRMLQRGAVRLSWAEHGPPLLRADATALPLPDRSVDTVVSAGVLAVMARDERRRALHEMARVCRREVRLLEPAGIPGTAGVALRARVIGLAWGGPLALDDVESAGLRCRVRRCHGLLGTYSLVVAQPRR